jgi:hypothetical protein
MTSKPALLLLLLATAATAQAAPKKKDKFSYFCGTFASGSYVRATPAYGEIYTYSTLGELQDAQDGMDTRRKVTEIPSGPTSGDKLIQTKFIYSDEEGGTPETVATLMESSKGVALYLATQPSKPLVCGKHPL